MNSQSFHSYVMEVDNENLDHSLTFKELIKGKEIQNNLINQNGLQSRKELRKRVSSESIAVFLSRPSFRHWN